jgi:hypothetical protein
MSDVAWSNIDKLVNILNIDSIVIRPAPTHYQEVIDKDEDMVHTCEACSFKTLVVAMQVAKLHGIKRIYAGFTKYTAIAQGWRGREIENAGEFEVVNPYYSEYDLNKIRATMESNGLVFDPTLTNCKHIQRLIHKSADNPFTRELDLLKEDGFIKDDEYSRFSEWLKSK